MMQPSDLSTRQRLDQLEREARERPRRHAVRLLFVVALGYLYPLLLALLVFGAVVVLLAFAPAIWQSSLDPRVMILYAAALVGALVLAIAILKTLWTDLPTPPGQPIADNEAPALRAMLDEVQRATGAPVVHKIMVDTHLNAGVAQRPRFGFWGPRTNYLALGMPLLIALTPEQFRTILAHELAHLRGGHNSFTAWIFRLQKTWETLGQSLAGAKRLRRVVIGWFAQWYGAYLSTTSLALRRLHEYDADRRSAELDGAAATAQALTALTWIGYRMEKSFWPALFRRTASDPLPPADILGQIAEFLSGESTPEQFERFRRRELRSRTPITSEHPCLADRLGAIGQSQLLENPSQPPAAPAPGSSALVLLGDARERLWKIANATFKATVIQRWRYEHALAKQTLEKVEKAAAVTDADPDIAWQKCQAESDSTAPQRAQEILREFLGLHPEHAYAHFELGRMLLIQDDEAGSVRHFESAMQHGSDCIAPALQILLDYYRDAGRDAEADPIRQRLADHQQALVRAGKERLTVASHDRFAPHDLKPSELEKITRILFRYSRITAAWLVKKELKLFSDKPSYVLLVRRRTHLFDERSDKFLVDSLRHEMPIACAVLIQKRRPSRLQKRIVATSPNAIFLAQD